MNSGELVRDVRRRAGLSQRALADRSGISRVVISQYETGRREPSVKALRRLAAAGGYDLALVHRVDPAAAAQVLEQVLDLAESLPHDRFAALPPSPFPARVDR